jgi:hypothetical protein
MDLIEYPTTDYNSWATENEADEYFDGRLNVEAWAGAGTKSTAAMLTAFRSLNVLNITIDPTEADQLQALKDAQIEQALYELTVDTDGQPISAVTIGGMLSVKLASENTPPGRHSKRAIEILFPYLSGKTITRTR